MIRKGIPCSQHPIKSDLLNYSAIHGESPGALVIEEERLLFMVIFIRFSG